jgi:hypothetical protein
MSKRLHLPTAILLAAATVAACTGGGGATAASPTTGQPTSAPSAAPSEAPSPEGLAHPTGPTDVILSYDLVGGFVPPEYLAAHVPIFTLYGDGTVVFVQTTAEAKQGGNGVVLNQPIRTATLTEEQIQALLLYALQDGGLAVSKTEYQNMMIADAPTAVFTISADNDTKTVSAYGLGFEQEPSADSAVLKQLAALGERLANFDQDGAFGSAPYEATAYRATLTEQTGLQGVQIAEWPFKDLTVADFTFPADPNALQQGTATLTPEQAASLGVEGYENGIVGGYYVKGDDGKTYSLVLRPLLPNETT